MLYRYLDVTDVGCIDGGIEQIVRAASSRTLRFLYATTAACKNVYFVYDTYHIPGIYTEVVAINQNRNSRTRCIITLRVYRTYPSVAHGTWDACPTRAALGLLRDDYAV